MAEELPYVAETRKALNALIAGVDQMATHILSRDASDQDLGRRVADLTRRLNETEQRAILSEQRSDTLAEKAARNDRLEDASEKLIAALDRLPLTMEDAAIVPGTTKPAIASVRHLRLADRDGSQARLESSNEMSKKPRARDHAWEALVDVTNANEAAERGRLNTALSAIKSAWESEGGRPEDLAEEIPLRADAYRALWPSMALTPTALAVHWKRVMGEQATKKGASKLIDEMKKEK